VSNATDAVVANKYARMRLAPPAEILSTQTGSLLRQCGPSKFVAMFFQSRGADFLRL
jgi:hypothetical protein